MPKPYTPKRRLAMQIVMWVILLLMVGLAGLVSTHRRGVFETRLDSALQQEGLSIQLPRGWEIIRHSQDDGGLLYTAMSAKELLRARTLSVWRYWSDTGDTPADLVYGRLHKNAAAQGGETTSLAIDGHPAAIGHGEFSSDELMGMALSTYVAAIVPTSGHAIVVEYQVLNGDSGDEDLLRRVLQSIKLKDEPALAAANTAIELPSTAKIGVPDGFAVVTTSDANQTYREIRSTDPASTMKRVHFFPTILEARDGANTIRTQLSLRQSGFDDARVHEVSATEFRIEPDANSADRAVRPIRAYVLTDKKGSGFIAVFKGGEGEQWIDDAWNFVRNHTEFADERNFIAMSRRGSDAVQELASAGLGKFFPEDPGERWLIAMQDTRTFGWVHLQQKTGSLGGTFESRTLLPQGVVLRALESFQGNADLKSYRSTSDVSFTQSFDSEQPKFTLAIKGSSQLRDGKLTLVSAPSQGPASSVEMKIPSNYLPGGWLVDVLSSLPDEPLLLRTDMAMGFEDASVSDLLTVMIRTDPDFKPRSDPDGEAEKCRIVEVVGSGSPGRWYFNKDGRIVSIQWRDHLRFVARDEQDIRTNFSRNSAMRP